MAIATATNEPAHTRIAFVVEIVSLQRKAKALEKRLFMNTPSTEPDTGIDASFVAVVGQEHLRNPTLA